MNSGIKVTLDDARLRAFPANLRREGKKLVRATAKSIQGRMVIKIEHGPKTGRLYRHGNVVHQASAPGEAPATDVGNLAGGITTADGGPLTEFVDVGAEYGSHLEYGTSRMAPRPFMKPSFEDERPAFNAGVAKLIVKARQ